MRSNPCVIGFRDQGFGVERGVRGFSHSLRTAGGSAGSQPPTPVKRKSAISNHTAAPERMLC